MQSVESEQWLHDHSTLALSESIEATPSKNKENSMILNDISKLFKIDNNSTACSKSRATLQLGWSHQTITAVDAFRCLTQRAILTADHLGWLHLHSTLEHCYQPMVIIRCSCLVWAGSICLMLLLSSQTPLFVWDLALEMVVGCHSNCSAAPSLKSFHYFKFLEFRESRLSSVSLLQFGAFQASNRLLFRLLSWLH